MSSESSSSSNSNSNSELSESNSASPVKQLGGKKPKGHKKVCKCVICKRGGADTVSANETDYSANDEDFEDGKSVSMSNNKDKNKDDVEGVKDVEDGQSASLSNNNDEVVSPSKGGRRRRRRTAKKGGKSRRTKSRRSTKRRRSSRRR